MSRLLLPKAPAVVLATLALAASLTGTAAAQGGSYQHGGHHSGYHHPGHGYH